MFLIALIASLLPIAIPVCLTTSEAEEATKQQKLNS